jgi:acyl-coenzyme A thioesterase PaaI-like protein
VITPANADFIRQRALVALSNNRIPGYHFAGNYLDIRCPKYGTDGVVMEMDTAPHNANADGTTHFGALAFLADMALAGSCRSFVDPSRRTATLCFHMQFLDAEPRGVLRAETQATGFLEHTALPQANCIGRLFSGGQTVLTMAGTWVAPPTPDGRSLHPLPWEPGGLPRIAPLLKRADLDAQEKAAYRRVERVLKASAADGFITRFWDPLVKQTSAGAVGKLPVGLYVGNRVGHVQGGLLLNMALVTARAAVPSHPVTTLISAWYISPGQGKMLTARATVIQNGRNVAVVRTEIFAPGGKLVLEVVSNHAIAK